MYALKYSEWWWESLCCSVSTTPARLCVWKDGESARPVGLPGQSLNRRNRMWCNWYSMVDWCWTGSDDRHLNVGLRCVKTLIDILEPHVDDAQTSGITIVIFYSPINALVKKTVYIYKVAQKLAHFCTVANFIKFWPIFKVFPVRIRTFVIILSLKIPPHLKCVAILPCEMSMS